jgi:hypothetical protein
LEEDLTISSDEPSRFASLTVGAAVTVRFPAGRGLSSEHLQQLRNFHLALRNAMRTGMVQADQLPSIQSLRSLGRSSLRFARMSTEPPLPQKNDSRTYAHRHNFGYVMMQQEASEIGVARLKPGPQLSRQEEPNQLEAASDHGDFAFPPHSFASNASTPWRDTWLVYAKLSEGLTCISQAYEAPPPMNVECTLEDPSDVEAEQKIVNQQGNGTEVNSDDDPFPYSSERTPRLRWVRRHEPDGDSEAPAELDTHA